ncbi:DUF4198 domain-containing protein [Tuwongella immobilis]|uniref:Uncharacterized protein n=1 Tax=Tuwongella immobilis TaxID=692036 RepID=A0A6C2YVC1_9BACT|nr:DUF4198 domain-containing protein [Tuwongella immobilis]VIP05394.1 Uncharacterized protein OS=Phycisphaera mikurensis (strain NBRC 102666 / KCTC 22515 / FYK2301M01) GN=PSMK_26110 PE=4 SV=1 [Tuwongella immobilis]VTS08144.1 Uncharacterized protein OS=Phycisphaera mikurensis (strain NBRC 102666 / KCTC 22515 / FYK2301M01) GN=PSMK_26110 PE=4 SV=1 [Tuwongella immobilis]
MIRNWFALVMSLSVVSMVSAHFVFLVPDAKNPAQLVAVFSEDLEVDENVPADRLKGLKLWSLSDAGQPAALETTVGENCLKADLGKQAANVQYGTLTYGVMKRGEMPAFLLAYHPKVVRGGVTAKAATVGSERVPVELIPIVTGTNVKFQLLAEGKPLADAEVNVIAGDGEKSKLRTSAEGLTSAVSASGLVGAYAKFTRAKPGEHDGKAYTEARHYATLVVDFRK